MAVGNEDLRVFFMQIPVVNGCLFYSVLNHANYNATGGGLEFIYKPIIPSHKFVKYTCIYCCHSSRPTELARTEQSCEKRTVWMICLPSYRLFCF